MTGAKEATPGGRSLGQRAASGFAVMVMQTVGTQAVNFAAQIALGWFLFKEHFGLYALTTTIGMAAGLLRQVGVPTVIIRRYRRFHLWANPAVWMSGALGVASALLMVALAPLGAMMYDEPDLTGLILVFATAAPFIALGAVPEAQLRAQMRFRTLASIQFGFTVGLMALTVLCAWAGLGAYSFVVPRPIMRAIQLVILWRCTSVPVRRRPELRRWRFMLSDVLSLTGSNLARFAVTECDYLILGIFYSDAIVGAYYYAFGLSQRAAVALTLNLGQVLLPALSSIQEEPRRQVSAFLRATRLLAIVGVPACLLQAAMAEPAFRALLPDRWDASISVLQVLSVGMVFRVVSAPALSLISAQGRFRLLLRWSLFAAALFIVMVLIGAIAGRPAGSLGGALSVAIAVAAYMTIIGPLELWIAVRSGGAGAREVARIYAAPLLVGAGSVGAAWWLTGRLPATLPARDWILLAATPAVSFLLYVPAIAIAAPEDARELRRRVTALFARGGRAAPAPTILPP